MPAPNGRGSTVRKTMVMEEPPDYEAMVSEGDKALWEHMEQAFLRLVRKPSVRRSETDVGNITEEDLDLLAGKGGKETKAFKVYFKLTSLQKSPDPKHRCVVS